jgi:hypothetical protein
VREGAGGAPEQTPTFINGPAASTGKPISPSPFMRTNSHQGSVSSTRSRASPPPSSVVTTMKRPLSSGPDDVDPKLEKKKVENGDSHTSRYAFPIIYPLTCTDLVLECDKSFTCSDALAKHMRLQHNVEASAPGRGGNRKQKHDREEPSRPTVSTASDPAGFSIFKVEPHTPSEMHMPSEAGGTPAADDYFNGGRSPSPADEGIPSYLGRDLDPATGLIRGRAPDMVKYLVMKAKFSFALEQHSTLLEELRVLRAEECALRQGKDEALDSVMRMEFGWVPSFSSLVRRG